MSANAKYDIDKETLILESQEMKQGPKEHRSVVTAWAAKIVLATVVMTLVLVVPWLLNRSQINIVTKNMQDFKDGISQNLTQLNDRFRDVANRSDLNKDFIEVLAGCYAKRDLELFGELIDGMLNTTGESDAALDESLDRVLANLTRVRDDMDMLVAKHEGLSENHTQHGEKIEGLKWNLDELHRLMKLKSDEQQRQIADLQAMVGKLNVTNEMMKSEKEDASGSSEDMAASFGTTLLLCKWLILICFAMLIFYGS